MMFAGVVKAGFAFVGCFVLLAAVVWASDHPAQQRGALDFHTQGCERCHSITGVGGQRAPDLGSVGLRRTPRQIRRQILRGGHGMPPFGKVLANSEVDDLVVFLSSCRTDQAPGCREWDAP
jgi:mono/diheme cytochrome c family protein